VLRVRRAHVLAALRRAGVEAPDEVADAMYASLGRGVFELLLSAALFRRRLAAEVEFGAGAEVLAKLRERGSGAVIATAHTGNWDLVGCAVARRAPLTIVTKHLRLGVVDRLWQWLRARCGARLVAAGLAAREGARALARGELVAMLVDQAPERTRAVLRIPFLGELADVDLAPALVALRARAPIVVAFPVRRAGGHAFELVRVIEPPARPTRHWAERAMQQITADLEAFVRRHPEQWLWMHRRWKTTRAAPAALPGERVFAE
jgi:KDO2-lipid IV(A) lauroyltransferase